MSGPNVMPVGSEIELEDLVDLGIGGFRLINASGGPIDYATPCYVDSAGQVRLSKSDGTQVEATAEVISIDGTPIADGASGIFGGPGTVVTLAGTAGSRGFITATPGVIGACPTADGSYITDAGVFVDDGAGGTNFLFKPALPAGPILTPP